MLSGVVELMAQSKALVLLVEHVDELIVNLCRRHSVSPALRTNSDRRVHESEARERDALNLTSHENARASRVTVL